MAARKVDVGLLGKELILNLSSLTLGYFDIFVVFMTKKLTVFLILQLIPAITYDTSTLAIEAGQSATLTCTVTNPDDLDLPAEVQWMKVC